jgi:transposase-like protein
VSPRTDGIDQEHVERLSALVGALPPILVGREDYRVIDGVHRLKATALRGQETIEVKWFDGTPEEAFLRAVTANAEHGLPLTTRDRSAAALRIVRTHPQLSDRTIARTVGLSSSTVAGIRHRSGEEITRTVTRIGRDGRTRPVNSADGRRRVMQALVTSPQASLRELARISGVAPGTVRAVRRQIAQKRPDPAEPDAEMAIAAIPGAPVRDEPGVLIEKLLRDPALWQKEDGRYLLRLLQAGAGGPGGTDELTALTGVVPPHCRNLVLDLAQQCAERWQRFAHELDRRALPGLETPTRVR